MVFFCVCLRIDILLKQILVGPKPSALFFAYFEHALGIHLISPLGFLSVIDSYALPEKSLQFAALVKLGTAFINSLRAPSNGTDSAFPGNTNRYIFVANILYQYFCFLLRGTTRSLQLCTENVDDSSKSTQFIENSKLCVDSALQMLKNRRLLALLVIGKYERKGKRG